MKHDFSKRAVHVAASNVRSRNSAIPRRRSDSLPGVALHLQNALPILPSRLAVGGMHDVFYGPTSDRTFGKEFVSEPIAEGGMIPENTMPSSHSVPRQRTAL